MPGRAGDSVLPAVTQLLLMASCIGMAPAYICYNCASSAFVNNSCQMDHQAMVNATLGWQVNQTLVAGGFLVNCTAAKVAWDKCMILTQHKEKGKLNLYMRGCSDGTPNSQFSDPIYDVRSVNQTVCKYLEDGNGNSKGLVCYTFCEGDYCNGPQPPPKVIDECAQYANMSADDYAIPEKCGVDALSVNVLLAGLVVTVCVSWWKY